MVFVWVFIILFGYGVVVVNFEFVWEVCVGFFFECVVMMVMLVVGGDIEFGDFWNFLFKNCCI